MSYAEADRGWVEDELAPRLAKAGRSVCLEHDLPPGGVEIEERSRAVAASRKTLMVVSDAYLDGRWGVLEEAVTAELDPASRKRRLIPVLRGAGGLPLRIRPLVAVDLRRADDPRQWQRLLDAVDPTRPAEPAGLVQRWSLRLGEAASELAQPAWNGAGVAWLATGYLALVAVGALVYLLLADVPELQYPLTFLLEVAAPGLAALVWREDQDLFRRLSHVVARSYGGSTLLERLGVDVPPDTAVRLARVPTDNAQAVELNITSASTPAAQCSRSATRRPSCGRSAATEYVPSTTRSEQGGMTMQSYRPFLMPLCLAGRALALFPTAGFAGKEPKKRVAVVDFENKASHTQHQWGDLGGGMTEKLIEALIDTGKFVVLERRDLSDVLAENNLGNVAHVEPAVIGRLTSAQALIRGVITNVEGGDGEEGGFGIGKFKIGGKNQKVSVTINLRVIDTVTGQILQSKTIEGTATLRGIRVRRSDWDTDIKVNRNHPVGKAMDDAVARAVEQIAGGMESVPWQGSVSRVSGRQIIVNAGYQENVEPGLELRVFERGAEIIDKETNETLGRLDEEIGVIRIARVEPRFSIADIVQGDGFAAGNIVRPVAGQN